MCKVLNKRTHGMPRGAVYVGRPSKWGNPFVIGKDGTRDQVIAKYRDWLVSRPKLLGALHELRGKDLVCWCAPNRCHADVLLDMANDDEEQDDADYYAAEAMALYESDARTR
jgi:hypothetical protein